ncbi:MAG: exodeoxyribonuclease VII small subunit [Longimicrobiales bacterium]
MSSSSEGGETVGAERSEAAAGEGLETRLKRLEAIVQALDSDAIELEQALALFEEGVAHVRGAQEILAQAELKVEELIGPGGDQTRDVAVDSDDG